MIKEIFELLLGVAEGYLEFWSIIGQVFGALALVFVVCYYIANIRID